MLFYRDFDLAALKLARERRRSWAIQADVDLRTGRSRLHTPAPIRVKDETAVRIEVGLSADRNTQWFMFRLGVLYSGARGREERYSEPLVAEKRVGVESFETVRAINIGDIQDMELFDRLDKEIGPTYVSWLKDSRGVIAVTLGGRGDDLDEDGMSYARQDSPSFRERSCCRYNATCARSS